MTRLDRSEGQSWSTPAEMSAHPDRCGIAVAATEPRIDNYDARKRTSDFVSIRKMDRIEGRQIHAVVTEIR